MSNLQLVVSDDDVIDADDDVINNVDEDSDVCKCFCKELAILRRVLQPLDPIDIQPLSQVPDFFIYCLHNRHL